MIEQVLTVVAVKGDTAFLQAEPKPACAGCNGKCGSQVFAKLFGTDKKRFPYQFSEPVSVGQKVKLALDDSHIVMSSFVVYIWPLLFALVTAVLAQAVFGVSEGLQIGAAFAAGVLGFILAKHRLRRVVHDVKVIKIYPLSLPVSQRDGD
ncbi:SoxR reducing system RseC family protein [Pseudoalteromonas sp. T1lg10]|uniref:SoxR reducing system RseC family protein n=1 Tax=Pseudoalteromonas sp. T1lg10 TaxID=2077093 RepID=UPI000CF6540E|nr:SoxR reducing system RseC family protein [Pseudoalteromonas sp. T1lg10]